MFVGSNCRVEVSVGVKVAVGVKVGGTFVAVGGTVLVLSAVGGGLLAPGQPPEGAGIISSPCPSCPCPVPTLKETVIST